MKENKTIVLKDGTITSKHLKGKRFLSFRKDEVSKVYALFSNDDHGCITYLCKYVNREDGQNFVNVYHVSLTWRRLKKNLIQSARKENYIRLH